VASFFIAPTISLDRDHPHPEFTKYNCVWQLLLKEEEKNVFQKQNHI